MDCVLVPAEVDFYIETMKPRKMEEIGSANWLEWHERLQKLNQEAVIEASAMKEEYVKETLISHEKCTVLIHEALLINLWKHKVLPLLLQMEPDPETTFIAYSVLYHEGVAVGLLENLMYHSSSCESLGDAAADLLEYAYDSATQLLVINCNANPQAESGLKEILRQKEDISFGIGIRCLSILRYLSEHLDKMSLSVVSRIYNTHDLPILFVQILLAKPWFKHGKVYQHGKWINNDSEALCQAEAQLWLGLYHLLLNETSSKYYEITECRRSQLLKLLPIIKPVLLDQISPLVGLNQWIHQIAVTNNLLAPYKPVLLEIVLEIKNNILIECNKKWKKIAKAQLDTIFCKDKEQLFKIAQKLNSAYNTDLLENFEKKTSVPCKMCGKDALQRCSKCRNEWYCSRSCQVQHWKVHKLKCASE